MNYKKNLSVLLGILLFSVEGFSQENDKFLINKKDSINLPRRTVAYVADKITIVRPLNIEYTYSAPYNFTSKNKNISLPNGKANNFTQAKISASFNFIKKQNWRFGTTLNYRYTNADLNMTDPFDSRSIELDKKFHYLTAALNFTYFSTLFDKRTIYSSSIVFDGSEQHFERVRGLLSGAMILKADQKTKMTVGLLVNIDPSAQTPVIPIFTYEHKFPNGLIADLTLPKSVYIRKFVFNAGRISIGSELDRTSFYMYDIDGTSQVYEYRQLDITSGIVYEHAVGDFVITGKSGVKIVPTGRLFKKEDSYNHFIYEMKPDPTFYLNIGVSFNPFTFLKKENKKIN